MRNWNRWMKRRIPFFFWLPFVLRILFDLGILFGFGIPVLIFLWLRHQVIHKGNRELKKGLSKNISHEYWTFNPPKPFMWKRSGLHQMPCKYFEIGVGPMNKSSPLNTHHWLKKTWRLHTWRHCQLVYFLTLCICPHVSAICPAAGNPANQALSD